MMSIDSELLELEKLYDELEISLDQQYQSLLTHSAADPNGERQTLKLARRSEELGSRLIRSAQQWHAIKPSSDSGNKIAIRASNLRRRALQLLDTIERNAGGFRDLQCATRKSLQQLELGERYLQGVHGYKENWPKFIDARE